MIICDKCNTVLDNTISSKPTEYKTCLPCVRKVTPQADKSKLLQPEQDISIDKMLAEAEAKAIKPEERMKSIELDFSYEMIDGEVRVVFELKDYFKKPFFGFAFSKSQMMDFVNDLEEIELENRKK